MSEFSYGGEVEPMPDPRELSGEEWSEYIFMTDNPAGFVREWWFHNATSYWFIAERSTATDEITKTYPASEVFNSRVEFEKKDSAS